MADVQVADLEPQARQGACILAGTTIQRCGYVWAAQIFRGYIAGFAAALVEVVGHRAAAEFMYRAADAIVAKRAQGQGRLVARLHALRDGR